MESTALLLLALATNLPGMGAMFGWQPMPDGSEKVEYIVQIAPELAATLQEGHSIPITSDIPDNIGPDRADSNCRRPRRVAKANRDNAIQALARPVKPTADAKEISRRSD